MGTLMVRLVSHHLAGTRNGDHRRTCEVPVDEVVGSGSPVRPYLDSLLIGAASGPGTGPLQSSLSAGGTGSCVRGPDPGCTLPALLESVEISLASRAQFITW